MENKFLILGATGGIAYAFTKELIARKEHATLFVRNKEKAIELFGRSEYVEIVEGDINESGKFSKAARGKKFIFCGINFPYQEWESKFKPALDIVIKASKESKATILFPENNYAFGNISSPIKENTIPEPTTAKGLIRLELVQQLKRAAASKDSKVIILRLPDFFGPNVTNGLMKPVFGNAVNNKPMKWLVNADIPHQFAFTPDVARLFYLLTQKTDLPDYYLLNYGGETVSSVKSFCDTVQSYTRNGSTTKVTPKFVLSLIGLISPEVKSLKENLYQFENSIQLDETNFNQTFPHFEKTSMTDAIGMTVDWYKGVLK